ncbi:MAG: DUF1501 domain-containing protein [Roseibacillus sp.]
MKRRTFIQCTSGATALGLSMRAPAAPAPRGKAKHCIFLWLGGGASQVDTFDPKRLGDPARHVAGSAYKAIDTTVPGVQVCEHLSQFAKRMERATILRTVYHKLIDEHSAAVTRMHTGRPVSGTVVYPSIGSVVTHELPTAKGTPGYVLLGYPTSARGPGFLGSRHGYLYLTDTTKGPVGLSRPADVTDPRQERRLALLKTLRDASLKNAAPDDPRRQYDSVIDESLELAGGEFSKVFQLDGEPGELRTRYGSEFGQRCLLARRLVERGVRFVEVLHNLNFTNGTGWDTHNEGQLKQHLLIQEVDTALATLIDDLEEKKILDQTLIVLATEFGRPIKFDGRGGRGHQSRTFSVVLAGGGLRHRGAWGETDENCTKPIANPVSVPDLHATIHATLGIDPHKELFDGDRPVPITDRGTPIRQLFA